MNANQSFHLLICLLLSATLSSCNFNNSNKNEWKDPAEYEPDVYFD